MVEEFLDCDFFNPVNSEGNPPEAGECWNFASTSCHRHIDSLTLIEDTATTSFFLDAKISYGEFLIVFFLLFFLCFGIFKAFWGFIFPKLTKGLSQRDL